MFTLYKATQLDTGFTRGIILKDDVDKDVIMQKNVGYRLDEVIASEKRMQELEPHVERWIATAATPEAPGARYALLAPVKSNGTLGFIQW